MPKTSRSKVGQKKHRQLPTVPVLQKNQKPNQDSSAFTLPPLDRISLAILDQPFTNLYFQEKNQGLPPVGRSSFLKVKKRAIAVLAVLQLRPPDVNDPRPTQDKLQSLSWVAHLR